MSTIVRRALIGEAPLLAEVERNAGELFRSAPGLEWLADQEPALDTYMTAIRAGALWVAEGAGDILGFVAAQVSGSDLHILELSVRLEHQRKGVGRALMETAAAEACRLGLAGLSLTTFRDLAWNEPFYARLGFSTLSVGELDDRLRQILAAEVAAGLPGERRCAMRMRL